MKPFLVSVMIVLVSTISLNAQLPVLESYYELKDALVSSNSKAAAEQAAEFVKAVDAFVIPDSVSGKSHALNHRLDNLRADGHLITTAKNISKQREAFASLSANLFLLAKAVSLSAEPIYQQYCPMKKWYWLSNESAVRNPYYGQAMLVCGNITETIKP